MLARQRSGLLRLGLAGRVVRQIFESAAQCLRALFGFALDVRILLGLLGRFECAFDRADFPGVLLGQLLQLAHQLLELLMRLRRLGRLLGLAAAALPARLDPAAFFRRRAERRLGAPQTRRQVARRQLGFQVTLRGQAAADPSQLALGDAANIGAQAAERQQRVGAFREHGQRGVQATRRGRALFRVEPELAAFCHFVSHVPQALGDALGVVVAGRALSRIDREQHVFQTTQERLACRRRAFERARLPEQERFERLRHARTGIAGLGETA